MNVLKLADFFIMFGGSTVLLPLCLAMAVWMAVRGGHAIAIRWLLAVAVVDTLIILGKLWFYSCHSAVWGVDSPSGHAGFSTVAYGGLAVMLAAGEVSWRRRTIAAVTLLWLLAIGASLVVAHAHSVPEVLIGYTVGGAGVAWFARSYSIRSRPNLMWVLPVLALVVTIAMMPKLHYSMEPLLHHIGHWLDKNSGLCR